MSDLLILALGLAAFVTAAAVAVPIGFILWFGCGVDSHDRE
jgi:hypothetical protein